MSNKMEEKKMKPEEKRALVPKLRFPEFRDAGEWDAKELTDLIEVVTPPKKIPTTQYFAAGSYPIIDQSQAYISGWTDDEDAVISHELPLIVFGDHTCALKITDVPFAQGADGIKIFHASSGASTSYLYQHLLFNPVKMEEYKRHFSILKRKIVAFPEAKSGEQQKIADCLSSLDELITLETQKLDTLKAHKKGLMQQLFPDEGETLPKLRFPEFRDAGEWSAKQLKQICAVNPANSELPEIFAYIDLESVEAGILKAKKIISREAAPSRAQRLLDYGDVIFQIVRPYQRNNFYFRILDDIKYVASTGYAQLRAFESKDFLFQVIHTDEFVEKAIAKCTGSSYPAINSSDLAEISVAVPKPAEQQKIADCLASLDDLITAQTQQLAALKTHKKGLMQQLFPVLDEVSA